ncbi:hypothetical protein SDC9_160327 [bioreactor metagenome]|uniref:YokE-like PH domain-containing protein n=1 Tax=bioreactor metagenome TaxID=1076179 RepID=A0A645FFB3_9ZZZZ
MTVLEAIKQSKTGGICKKTLADYAQSQLAADEDLICAAIVYVNYQRLGDGAKASYLERMQRSSKIKAIFCVTTKRLLFLNNTFGTDFRIEMRLADNPRMDIDRGGLGVGGIKLIDASCNCFIAGNKKLINRLKSGILAASMIYRDHFAQAEIAAGR